MDYLCKSRYHHRVKSDLLIQLEVFSLLFNLVIILKMLHPFNLELHSLLDVEIRLLAVIVALGELLLDLLDLLEVFIDLVSRVFDVGEDTLAHQALGGEILILFLAERNVEAFGSVRGIRLH
jgi:hypothetical protein